MTGRDGYFRIDEMSSQQFAELVHSDWMNRLQVTSVHMHSGQVRQCIELALSCVEPDRRKRPSIGVIVGNLNKTVSSMILEALRNGSGSSIDQPCPCISSETEMLDTLQNKLFSYPLRVTDNSGRMHEATITSIGPGDTSTFQIIDCAQGLGDLITIDVHSTEPWILVGHIYGNVSIWNHQKQTRVMAFHQIDGQGVDELFTVAAIFIEPLQCFVVGGCEGHIHVYSYVKVDKLQKFRAHRDCVSSLAVHPREPFLLSASSDKLIKLWNWEIGWQSIRTFESHLGFVHQVRFNPQTMGNTFASCSSDSTLKIWNIHSPTPVATLDSGLKFRVHLDYFIPSGDMRYLVTGTSGWDGNAQIWDLQTNACIKHIDGLQAYGCNIAVVESLPGHPILLTVSKDQTVAFCDSITHRYENRVKFNLGIVRGFAYINTVKSLAIGCDKGIAIMEIN